MRIRPIDPRPNLTYSCYFTCTRGKCTLKNKHLRQYYMCVLSSYLICRSCLYSDILNEIPRK